MKRFAPKEHNISVQIIYGLNMIDLIVCGIGLFIVFYLLTSTIPFRMHIVIVCSMVLLVLMTKIEDERGYIVLCDFILYIFGKNKFTKGKDIDKRKKHKKQDGDIRVFMPIKQITDKFIHFENGSRAIVLKIEPIFFKYLTEEKKEFYVDKVYAKILRLINIEQKVQIVKLDIAKQFSSNIEAEELKEKELEEAFFSDELTAKEIAIRKYIVEERKKVFDRLNKNDKVYESNFYIVAYDKSENKLLELQHDIKNVLIENNIKVESLDAFEKAQFLKNNFYVGFDSESAYKSDTENIVDWILPDSILFDMSGSVIDGIPTYNYVIKSIPKEVDSAWAEYLCKIPNCKVVFDITPIENSKAIKMIDNSLSELGEKAEKDLKPSKMLEIQNQIEALAEVLNHLQTSKEAFYVVNIYLTLYDYEKAKYDKLPNDIKKMKKYSTTIKKDFRFKMKELGFVISAAFMRQKRVMESALINENDKYVKNGIGMYGNLLAASFPFVIQNISDVGGVNIGLVDDSPAIFNFFKRDNLHVNSNMIIIGKSGSGKSYFTKVLLSNLAAENAKIFILDPENEYDGIVESYCGKVINLANSRDGLINPFQIIKGMSDEDEDYTNIQQDVSMHLQFLESFFSMLLQGLPNDAFEILNNVIKKMYMTSKVATVDSLDKLKPEDYPTFDDLYKMLNEERRDCKEDWLKGRLDVILNYIEKFSGDGRNANLWNGYSKISAEENMIQFNFQQLLMNNNATIASAQMLLVIHWLNNEIMNNRNYNLRYNTNRKIIIIIDEAHVFIDEKNPVALDFMFNLAKRIRKYNGMQVVITQNIKDFVGTEAIARKSTAIINASQYSFIFALSPDDLNDLCKLYEKAGGINKDEQSIIIGNERGQAYFMASGLERGVVKIVQPKAIETVFKVK